MRAYNTTFDSSASARVDHKTIEAAAERRAGSKRFLMNSQPNTASANPVVKGNARGRFGPGPGIEVQEQHDGERDAESHAHWSGPTEQPGSCDIDSSGQADANRDLDKRRQHLHCVGANVVEAQHADIERIRRHLIRDQREAASSSSEGRSRRQIGQEEEKEKDERQDCSPAEQRQVRRARAARAR